ncbi:hypothetical protein Sjap_008729 [Stephania japonica]|uniref:CBS domain-containing protein n=1 Tax=Stephania japonica TaxID=461633 RepID=A0AAP0JSC9_9MAGN
MEEWRKKGEEVKWGWKRDVGRSTSCSHCLSFFVETTTPYCQGALLCRAFVISPPLRRLPLLLFQVADSLPLLVVCFSSFALSISASPPLLLCFAHTSTPLLSWWILYSYLSLTSCLIFKSVKSQSKSKVKDIMSSPAVVLTPDKTVLDAAILMLKEKFHRIPIVNEEGQIVGICCATSCEVNVRVSQSFIAQLKSVNILTGIVTRTDIFKALEGLPA